MKSYAPIIVISGAVGSGKGTVLHALTDELELTWVPTHTTRPMRHDDTILSHRIYDTDTAFLRHKDRGEFIESVEIAGHFYGLLREDLEKEIRSGHAAAVEIDVNGGVQLDKEYNQTLLIFITANETDRRNRVAKRHMHKEELEARFSASRAEEKKAHEHYDYIIENIEDSPHECIEAIKSIIQEHFPTIKERD